MAHLFCNFLDLRSHSTNYYKLHFLLPSKKNFSISHSFTSSFIKINRKPLLCKPASPPIDVISTHEHSDGSLVFRFGDPTKVVEKPVIVIEEIENESVEEYGVVNDLDGDSEIEVFVEKGEIEMNGSGSSESDLVDSEKPVVVVVDEQLGNEGVIESSSVEDVGSDSENEVNEVEREVNLTELADEFDAVELETPLPVEEEIEFDVMGQSSVVKVLNGDRESEVVFKEAEREVNDSGFTELETPVTVAKEIESDVMGQSSVIKVLDGDRESEVVFKEAEREVGGSTLAELPDEFNSVGVVEGGLVGGDCENKSMFNEAEREVNNSGLTEVETPVIVVEEIESDVMGQSSAVKVLDGDREREVGCSTLTELPDEFNPVGVVEGGLEDELSVPSNVAVVVSSSPESDIQNTGFDKEVLNEDLSLENVTAPDEISEIVNTIVTEELSEKNIGNATTLQAVPLEAEYIISQSSTGIAVTVDDLTVSEHQNVDGVFNNGTMTIEDSTSYSEVVENSTDVTVDSVEAESQDEVGEDGIEIYSSELLSNSTNLQVDVSLSEETSQVSVQTVETENECESCVIDIAAKSHQLEADITDIEAQTSETGNGIKNEIVKDESESDGVQIKSLSPQLADELQNEIIEDSRELASSELLSNSPNPQVDVSLSEGAEFQSSQVPLQSVATGIGSEIDAVDIVSSSPQYEAAINLSTETETRTFETGNEIANEIVKDESESGVIQFASTSPPLEAGSKLDEEMSDGKVEKIKEDEITGTDGDMIQLTAVPPQENVQSSLHEETDSDSLEELQDDERVLSPSMTNDVGRDLVLETERISGSDDLQITQLPVASGNEMVELESTEYARNSEEIMTDLVLSSGAALLPHPTKVLTGGEDAYFVTGQTWLGVADGVLQWSLDGAIPGVYAQDLIRNSEKLASDRKGNSIRYPLDLLNSSVAETLSSGCSTVLLARFDGQVFHVANIGDSGFIILRHGTVYKRSLPMLYAFHLPLQIERDDNPSHLAELYQVDLEEDDVIVTATDGLFDNLYDQEISSIVSKSLAADLKLEEIAELLATKAQEVGRSTSSRSPFADSAQAAGYVGYTGGKIDDVTVIVSVVQRRSSSLTL